LCLRTVRLSLLEVSLSDGVVRIEILRAKVEFVRKLEGVACLDISRAEQRVVRASYVKQRLASAHMLTLHHHDAADRPTHLRDYRRGLEVVVFDRSGEAQNARQRTLPDRHDLYVRHLLGRQREQLGFGLAAFRGRE